MSLLSWLPVRKRLTTAERSCKSASRGKPAGFRPRLERLEDRCTPSTLSVTSAADGGAGSLRYEIAVAHSGDTIVFSSSLAHKTITLNYGELLITKNLTIQGLGAGQLTVSGNHNWRVFDVAAGVSATLSGLTIANGNCIGQSNPPHAGMGSGVYNAGALTISNCTLSNNSKASEGGGVYNAGALTVSGCTLSNNSAALEGGGIYNAASATLTVSNSTLSGDVAANIGGGGVYNAGTATVSGCTLSGDSAPHGGGIYNAGSLTILDSIFSSNKPDNIYGPYADGGGNTFS